jgi:hypothetical protein
MAIQKPEWFPMDPAKFLTDSLVDSMTTTELGAAFRLLCRQWIDGALPDDLNLLARLARLDGAAMAEAWVVLQKFFPEIEPGKRANRFMWIRRETVIAELDRKSDEFTQLARKRWDAARNAGGNAERNAERIPHAMPTAMPTAMQEQSRADNSRADKKTLCDTSAKNADASRGDASPAKKSKKAKPAKQTDPRYTPTRNFLAAAFREVCSTTEPPPWDGHCAKELTNWLATHDLGLPAIEELIRNVAKSERADRLLRRPQHLIPDLRQYNVPRDRFGDGPQRTDGRRSSASVGVHPPIPPEPAVEWPVPEAVDLEAGAKLWEDAKEKIRPRVSRNAFDTWLKPTRSLGLGKETLYVRLEVEDYARDMGRFDEVLRDVLPDRPVKFVVPTEVSHA